MTKAQQRLVVSLLTTTAFTGLSPAVAQNLPTGGSIAAGGVSISSPSTNALAIQQSTPSAIVNWQAFSIGQGYRVDVTQPSASSAILNRVTSEAPSTIAGSLTANGQVFLVNPNGIAITRTGTIEAAGFVASTLGISDADFLAGRRTFSGNGASAAVSNAGRITIGRGGYAALIGGTVDNSGTISVPLGKVGLGSGERVTLDFSGDGFLQVEVPTKAGDRSALVKHSGTIRAEGGSVHIHAATAREAARRAVNLSGVVEAHSISGRSGAIVIGGGGGGGVRISGRLDASGHGAGLPGGRVAVSGRRISVPGSIVASGTTGGRITLAAGHKAKVSGRLATTGWNGAGGLVTVTGDLLEFEGASVDASGTAGGGTVLGGVGASTRTVSLDKATVIRADATDHGRGGSITLWSSEATTVKGTLSARGGRQGGDGGTIETSGGTIDFSGATIDTSALHGAAGTWLVDPVNLTVDEAAATTISANLATTNVTLATTASGAFGPGVQSPGEGDITIAAPISWSSPQSFALKAYHAIAIDAPITIGGAGKLQLTAATDPASFGEPLLSIGTGASVQFSGEPGSGQALSINGQAYSLLYSIFDLQAINLDLAGSFALAKPIDASGITFTDAPAASEGRMFSGRFEGLGNTITNLVIDAPARNAIGLFGTSFGTISDIGLIDSSIRGQSGVGSLVGFAYESGGIRRSYATGTVTGVNDIGGLVGFGGAPILLSHATGDVTGTGSRIGGLVGSTTLYGLAGFDGRIADSYATGKVAGGGQVGGLVGSAGGPIDRSYATGTVQGTDQVGGLVGSTTISAFHFGQVIGVIRNSYATGNVSGVEKVGGLVGESQAGVITSSYASGAVTGTSQVGGLVGRNSSFTQTPPAFRPYADLGSISTSYATGPVKGTTDVGGLVGSNEGAITQAYATGKVQGATNVGGLVGTSATFEVLPVSGPSGGDVIVSYATGPVAGMTNVGGLVGRNDGGRIGGSYASGEVGGTTRVGGLVGLNTFDTTNVAGTVESSHATGSVSGTFAIGGLVGSSDGPITRAYAEGDVTGVMFVGGLVGHNRGPVTQGYTDGNVSGETHVGGLVGANLGPITLSHATGNVTGENFVGGLLGSSSSDRIESTFALGAVEGTGSVGGLVGWNGGGRIVGSYASGDVSGVFQVGGLVGMNTFGAADEVGRVETSHATGSVTGTNSVGGLVGSSDGTIAQAYATGDVTGVLFVGGLVGHSRGPVTQSYAGGNVLGTSHVGGLVGASLGPVGFSHATGHVIGENFVGGLIGSSASATVEHTYATGDVQGTVSVGGLVGTIVDGTVTESYATGAVRGNTKVGGLVGESDGAITLSHATGSVTGTTGPGVYKYGGGLVGASSGTVTQSYATGTIGGVFDLGGLVGWNTGAIAKSYATGAGVGVGGLVGRNAAQIVQSYATGTVNSIDSAAGLVNTNESTGTILQSYAIGNVTARGVGGGLVAINDGYVGQSFALGNVSGRFAMGGLVAVNNGTITESYSAGVVSNDFGLQGMVASNTGTVTFSYWDIDKAGPTSAGGVGLTTAQLKSGLPAGSDPAVWDIVPGVTYPFLRALPQPAQ